MNAGVMLKQLRLEKGYTLEQLGEKVGVGKSTIRKWENGMIANMRSDKIQKLAYALDIDPVYIIELYNDSIASENVPKNDFTSEEVNLIDLYRKLSVKGREKVTERINELLQLERVDK